MDYLNGDEEASTSLIGTLDIQEEVEIHKIVNTPCHRFHNQKIRYAVLF
jgi:hypothetical protein